MKALLKFFAWRHLKLKWMRNLLTGLGIAFGVALFMSIHLINRSTLRSFQNDIDSMSGGAHLTVFGGDLGFSEELLDQMREVSQVKYVVPMIESRAYFKAPNGNFESLVVLGADLLAEGTVRTYKTEGEDIMEDPLVFFNQPDSIILTRSFCEKYGFKTDDQIKLSTVQGDKLFTVRGILSPTGPAQAYGGSMALMDIDGARISFGKVGRVDRADIVLRDKKDALQAQKSLEKLSSGLSVEDADTQMQNSQQMVASFQGMLSFLSTLALVISVLIVSNVVAISIQERRKEIGVLRALGTSKNQIIGFLLIESSFVGLVSSALGILLGYILAHFLLGFVVDSLSGQTMTQINVPSIYVGAFDILLGLGSGTLATFLATLWPARQTTHIAPIEALRPAGNNNESLVQLNRFWKWAPWVGLLGAAYCMALLAFEKEVVPQDSRLTPVLALGAAILIAPPLIFLIIKVLAQLIGRRASIVVQLSFQNLLRNPGRTISNSLSLVIGLLLVGVISTVNLSFSNTLLTWARKITSFGQVVVSSSGRIADFRVQPVQHSLIDQLRKVEGIDRTVDVPVRSMRYIRVSVHGKDIALKTFDDPGKERDFNYIDALSTDARTAGEMLFDSENPKVLASEVLVNTKQLHVGGFVELSTPTGLHKFQVGAVVRDFANANGVLYISRDQYLEYWKDDLVTAFGLRAAEGVAPDTLRQRIDAQVGKDYGLMSTLTTKIVDDIEKLIEQNFKLNRAIELASLLVGLFGLLNAFLISIMERRREIGLVRSLGGTGRQILAMILIEGFVLGVTSGVISAVFGVSLAYLWTERSLQELLGWNIEFMIPWSTLVEVVALGVGVALIASFFPAYKTSKASIREALEYE